MTNTTTTTTNTALRSCPFCGSRSLDYTCRESEPDKRVFFYAFCNVCEASGPTDYVQASAIERWNGRQPANN